MYRFTAGALVAITLATVWAGEWDRKPFTEWDQNSAFRVLTDSPWSRRQSVKLTWTKQEQRPFTYKDVPAANPTQPSSGLGPLGGIGAGKPKFPDSTDLIFRWASALPVRHATAIYRMHDEKLGPSKLNSLIPQPGPDYVLEIFGVPVELAHMGAETLESLAKTSVFVTTSGGRTIRPSGAKVVVQGSTLSLLVHFPRTPALEAADKEIECVGDLQIMNFKVRFKLAPMMYQNHLEL